MDDKVIAIQPATDEFIKQIKNKILSAKNMFDIDDILTEIGLFSAEAKIVFLCGVFKLALPSPSKLNEYASYETILKFVMSLKNA